MENKITQRHQASSSCLKHAMDKSCIELQADQLLLLVDRPSDGSSWSFGKKYNSKDDGNQL